MNEAIPRFERYVAASHADRSTSKHYADGCPLKAHRVSYRLQRWGEMWGVGVAPHRLRHTLVTRPINRGMSLESLSKLLAHKYLSTTQQYARLHDPTVQEQFEAAVADIEGVAVSDWPHPTVALTAAQQPGPTTDST